MLVRVASYTLAKVNGPRYDRFNNYAVLNTLEQYNKVKSLSHYSHCDLLKTENSKRNK